ncbi:unnamed protein product [Trichogramma brassicae]|uniref:Uncharacterized protein n=1 Tax=Trichogramma brassicae TaxID=86971 RepID=A0A6H5IXF9_9HYME|nr:unnamed protein product [Trichogramma brassicae]
MSCATVQSTTRISTMGKIGHAMTLFDKDRRLFLFARRNKRVPAEITIIALEDDDDDNEDDDSRLLCSSKCTNTHMRASHTSLPIQIVYRCIFIKARKLLRSASASTEGNSRSRAMLYIGTRRCTRFVITQYICIGSATEGRIIHGYLF